MIKCWIRIRLNSMRIRNLIPTEYGKRGACKRRKVEYLPHKCGVPGSASASKNLRILTQKLFLSSRNYDPGCLSRIPGSKRRRIPDPPHCTIIITNLGQTLMRFSVLASWCVLELQRLPRLIAVSTTDISDSTTIKNQVVEDICYSAYCKSTTPFFV